MTPRWAKFEAPQLSPSDSGRRRDGRDGAAGWRSPTETWNQDFYGVSRGVGRWYPKFFYIDLLNILNMATFCWFHVNFAGCEWGSCRDKQPKVCFLAGGFTDSSCPIRLWYLELWPPLTAFFGLKLAPHPNSDHDWNNQECPFLIKDFDTFRSCHRRITVLGQPWVDNYFDKTLIFCYQL